MSDVSNAKFSLQHVHDNLISTRCLVIGSLAVILSRTDTGNNEPKGKMILQVNFKIDI